MTVLRTQYFNGVGNGNTPTSGNTVTNGDTPISVSLGTGCTAVGNTTSPIEGVCSIDLTAASGQVANFQYTLTGSECSVYFVLPLLAAPTLDTIVASIRIATGKAAWVTALANGKFKISSGTVGAADRNTTAAVYNYASGHRPAVHLKATIGTSTTDGKIDYGIYDSVTNALDAGMSIEYENTATNTSAGTALSLLQMGFPGTEAATRAGKIDAIRTTDNYAAGALPSANNPPVVNAGTTQTVAANTLVTLAATSSDSDGSIASVAWTQNSGPTVTLSSTTINGPTFTPTVPGVVSLRYTATDNLGATAFSDVIINVTSPSSRPLATISNAGIFTNQGGAASLEAALADESDTTYIQSPTAPAGAVIIFSITPLSTGSITVKHGSKQDISSPVITRLSELLQAPSNTVIASHSDNLTTSFVDYTWTVTDTQALSITDRNSLRVRITDTQN